MTGTAMWQNTGPQGWFLPGLWCTEGENGADPDSQPEPSFPPQGDFSKSQLGSLQVLTQGAVSAPRQPGQQALTVRCHEVGLVSGGLDPLSRQREKLSVQPSHSHSPRNGLGHPIWSPTA